MTINPAQRFSQPSMQGAQPPITQQGQAPQDPRLLALQQYMQMQGAQQPPNLPQQMPNGQGGTRSMSLQENQQAVDGMEQGSNEAYPNDTNAYFQEEGDEDVIDQEQSADDAMYDELNTAPDRRPSYVTGKGQPSPNEEYTDEELLQMLADKLGK